MSILMGTNRLPLGVITLHLHDSHATPEQSQVRCWPSKKQYVLFLKI